MFKVFYYWLRKWFLIKVALVGAPVFYFLIHRRAKESTPPSPKALEGKARILIIPQLTRIGDLVCATPMFRAIKQKYPKSHLAVLVTRRIAPIIKNNPNIDEIIQFNSFDFAKRVLPEIRKKKFDWAFNISSTVIGSLVSFYGLIPNRVKLTKRPRALSEILTDCFNNFTLRYHHHTYLPKYYLDMLKFIGIESAEEVQQVFTSPAGEVKVEQWLKENDSMTKLVGISITANNKIKEWGDEKFKAVAKYVHEKYGAKVIFLGTPRDEKRINDVIESLRHSEASTEESQSVRHSRGGGNLNDNFFKALNFNLEELPSLMKRLNLYIAVDTGPIYIAHALKVPLIDITGPCDPDEQPPNDGISLQVRPPAHIKPSSFVMQKPGHPTEHVKALQSIKADQVFQAIDDLKIL